MQLRHEEQRGRRSGFTPAREIAIHIARVKIRFWTSLRTERSLGRDLFSSNGKHRALHIASIIHSSVNEQSRRSRCSLYIVRDDSDCRRETQITLQQTEGSQAAKIISLLNISFWRSSRTIPLTFNIRRSCDFLRDGLRDSDDFIYIYIYVYLRSRSLIPPLGEGRMNRKRKKSSDIVRI